MTPIEEKFNRDIGFVLHKIKEQSLYATKGHPILYHIDLLGMGTSPSPEHEGPLLKKIEEWGGITITGEVAMPTEIMVEGWNVYLNINQPKFDEVYSKYQPTPTKGEQLRQDENNGLSDTDKKRLFVLEKLKEEWELVPKKNSGPMMIQAGLIAYEQRAYETRVSWKRHNGWQRDVGIDFYQLKNILQGFKDEGLLEDFDFINPAV